MCLGNLSNSTATTKYLYRFRYNLVIPMVSIRIKVGSKGQIVIPKVFRDAYGIKEGCEVVIMPTEDGLIIKRKKSVEEIIETLKDYREKRRKAKAIGKLGDLSEIDLEDEFDEDIS